MGPWAVGAVVVACGACAACGFSPHAAGDAAVGADSDGATTLTADAFPDTPPGEVCFGTLAYDRICYLAANVPTGTKKFQVVLEVNTDDGPTCTGNVNLAGAVPGNPCIIAAGDIGLELGAELDVFGSRPLILLATAPQGIDVAAGTVINAGADAISAGPGSPVQCAGTTTAAQKSGGFGGSFLVLGGKGGLGDGNNVTSRGLPAPVRSAPTMLQGGCPGGIGANNDVHTAAAGGGAVALIAMKITVDGIVTAGGAGGVTPNQDQAGGNGGGAGGMIVLDAPAINGMGELDAKGGGGGEGKGGNTSTSGNPGYNPIDRAEDGLGGSTSMSSGGDGGHGGPYLDATSVVSNAGGDGRDGTSAGGGGGGGAAGLVLAKSALPVLLVSSPVAVVAP